MIRSSSLLRLMTRLIARRDALRRILAAEVERLREPIGIPEGGDSVDAAVAAAQDEICSSLAELESRELAEIEEALRRIAERTYGRCVSCGGPISAARLEVLPCATRCIACQRRDERRGRVGTRPAGFSARGGAGVEIAAARDFDQDPELDCYSVRIETP